MKIEIGTLTIVFTRSKHNDVVVDIELCSDGGIEIAVQHLDEDTEQLTSDERTDILKWGRDVLVPALQVAEAAAGVLGSKRGR